MNKSKETDLDVDFIGGQGSLTEEEEKALSEFFKKNKSKSNKAGFKNSKSNKRPNVTA